MTTITADAVHSSTTVRTPNLTARRPSLLSLTAIELRKALDTRSGRLLLLAVLGLGLAGLGWRLYNADSGPVSFEHFLQTAIIGVQLILPVIGVMAMTAEWTQRTALSTFTSTPRRGRVLTAKVGAALGLGAGVTGAVVAASALATVVGGAITGTDPSWDNAVRLSAGVLLVGLLNLLMAAAFGALVPQTAAAVTLFLVAPTLWATAGVALLNDAAQWLDVFGAYGRLVMLEFTDLPQTVVSLSAWIVLPLVVGVVMSLRREVK
jgi:ABC-type transport system involved in multi-copper enzyme maturation permease subunit